VPPISLVLKKKRVIERGGLFLPRMEERFPRQGAGRKEGARPFLGLRREIFEKGGKNFGGILGEEGGFSQSPTMKKGRGFQDSKGAKKRRGGVEVVGVKS